ncbi:hypothetical protein [Flagellimonas okinawensis]|uniref:Lipoprotein n=1 Tax=Flagellimonas okinawensis TaxID=3031324 RepID=A0ABT5XM11_9FLAO|nr:hypothetical protein [[Muricauda] okinawensis]MDF0706928.1 hypothetical protein [[Muricauda] okinawensis]
MRKLVLTGMAAAAFLTACSKDDDKKCESCTSDLGNKFEICDNGNGTYDVTAAGEKETITEEELGGLTPKLVVELACESDIELEF